MTDKYNDMRIQNTITTVVAPIVSLFDGKDTFFNSLRTPHKLANRVDKLSKPCLFLSTNSIQPGTSLHGRGTRNRTRTFGLETDVYPLNTMPLFEIFNDQLEIMN